MPCTNHIINPDVKYRHLHTGFGVTINVLSWIKNVTFVIDNTCECDIQWTEPARCASVDESLYSHLYKPLIAEVYRWLFFYL